MDVHLIGGGWDDALAPTLYGPFVEAAARRAGATPRILLVVMGTDAESLEYHEKYVHTLGLVGGHELVVERVAEGTPLDASALDGVDGLFVGGGPTPEYHASLAGAYARIRSLVAGGMPYAGFSAGAAIAGSHAVIGGWRLDGVPVCPEDSNEDLDAVAVVEGHRPRAGRRRRARGPVGQRVARRRRRRGRAGAERRRDRRGHARWVRTARSSAPDACGTSRRTRRSPAGRCVRARAAGQ